MPDTPSPEERAADRRERTAAAVAARVDDRRGRQRPFAAVAGAALAVGLGAALYGGVAAATGVQYGATALGAGALAGLLVRLAGRGVTARYGLLAALGAVAAVGLGHLVGHSIVLRGAAEAAAPWSELLAGAWRRARDFWTPMDYCFFAIAAVEAWWLGFGRLPRPPRPAA